MYPTQYINFTFQQIQIFLTVAELGSQTKAANYLHLSQSMISKNIARLEQDLGLILFIHHQNHYLLTPAARSLYQELKTFSNNFERAIEKAKEAQMVQEYPIHVGVPAFMNDADYVKPILDRYIETNPNFRYQLEFYELNELAIKLESEDVDFIITGIFDVECIRQMGFSYHYFRTTKVSAYMKKENILAKKASIPMSELANQNFMILSLTNTPSYLENYLMPLLKKYNLHVRIAFSVQSNEALMANLNSDKDIFICDETFRLMPNTAMVPIEGEEHELIIAWKPGNTIPYVDEFIHGLVKQLS